MNKDIQTLIDREAENYADSKGIYNQHGEDLLKMGFNKGAHFALSLLKWRKVSEVLPDVRDEDFQVLGRQKNGEYKTIWVIKDSIPPIDVFNYHGVTEWMPIPNND